MYRRHVTIILLFLFAVSCPLVDADRGLIPLSPEISVYEPGQKAIIAWNGQEEILILSTDVTSTQQTMVLEVLPLPSEPVVEAASFQSFEMLQGMIWDEGMNQLFYSSGNDARSGSVEVLFQEQIGVHNITIVKANDTSELIDWAGTFLSENDINVSMSMGEFEPAIEDYMNRGFRHYVLDLVTYSPEEKSVNPILYRFESSYLYYPLLITSPVAGNSEITLFLLTETKMNENYYPLQKAFYRVNGRATQPIEFVLSKGSLSKIDLRIGRLFEEQAWLTVIRYEGELSLLNKDLMISQDASVPSVSVEATVLTTIAALSFLLGVASTLMGTLTILLITRRRKP